MAKILITGGMGFIGSNFIHYWLRRHPQDDIVNLDLLTYAGNVDNVSRAAALPNYRFVRGDIGDFRLLERVFGEGVDAVVHFAAESHVDRSIQDPSAFVRTNVLGTQQLLEAARRHEISKFIQISTDEVYGSLGAEGCFTETTPLAPNSPYSASKAGGDLLARAYFETYGFPVITLRCSNNYGPRQFPEKLIPMIITRAFTDRRIPIYGDGQHVRDWLYVDDHCAAIELALLKGKPGEVYNVGGSNERTNLEVARRILAELGKPESLLQFVDDRPGHDRRYAIDAGKIRAELGWKPVYSFEAGLKRTVSWYVQHAEWWQRIESGEYRREPADRGGNRT